MLALGSLFKVAATFDPYNQHSIQDIGAFQIGLGAVLLLAAAFPREGLAVALFGVGFGSGAHVISHIVGRDLGGTPIPDRPSPFPYDRRFIRVPGQKSDKRQAS